MGKKGCTFISGYRYASSSVLVVGTLLLVAFAAVFATCSADQTEGNQTTWTSGGCTVTYDSGNFTVSKDGDGAMEDYTDTTVPWRQPSIRNNVTSITIAEGVTHLGDYAFCYFINQAMVKVTIPDSVTSIGAYTFYYCTSIECVVIGSGVSSIGNEAFSCCSSLNTVYFNTPLALDTTGSWWVDSSDNILFIRGNGHGAVSGNALGASPVNLNVTTDPYIGYNFKKLNTKEDGSGTGYDLGDSYQYTGRSVLHAIWIQKTVVEWPEIAGAEYDGTAKTASIPESTLYTVSYNPGGTDAGDYPVTLTLTDPATCTWPDVWTAAKTVQDAFKIAQRPATVTADDKSKMAGEQDPQLTVQITGLIGSDTVTYTVARDPGETAGTYAIRVTGEASQGNYAVSFVDGTFTIHDQAYTVTFDVQGHGTAPLPQTVDYGAQATKPADPSAYGYDFDGWYKEAGCTNPWNFEQDTVLGNTTLYAKWTPSSFTATLTSEKEGALSFVYRVNDGTPVTYKGPFSIAYGHTLQVIAVAADGHAFHYWDNGSQWATRTVSSVTGDINWTARSETSFAKVTFHSNNGSDDTRYQIFAWGVKLSLMPNEFSHPGGLHFVGWSTSPGSNQVVYNDASVISADSDTDLYAVWSNAGFRIIITQNGHGTITGPEWVLAGTDATCTVVADQGYIVTDLVVDGRSVGMLGAYTVFNVMADHTVTATYGPADKGSETYMDIEGRVVEKSVQYEQDIEIQVTNLSSADNSNVRSAVCYFDNVSISSKSSLSPAGVRTQGTTSTITLDSASAVISDEEMKKIARMTAATQSAAGIGSGASDLAISVRTPEGKSDTASAQLSLRDDGTLNSISVMGDTGGLQLDARTIAQLAKGSVTKIVVEKADVSDMNDKQKSVAKDHTVYDAYILLDSKRVTTIDGTLILTLPYTLKAGESPSDVHIYYLDDAGQVFYIGGIYQDGYVSAQLEHLSYYFASQGYKDSGSAQFDLTSVLWAVALLMTVLVLLSITLYWYVPQMGDKSLKK